MSSLRSAGVRSMTLVKLTFSLATVSATIPASRPARRGPGQRPGRGRAEHRAERVGPGVAEHGPLGQVLGQQREARAERRGHRRQAGRPVGAARAARGDQPGRQRRDLDRAAGTEVEQVQQVGAAGDQPGVDEHVGPLAAEQQAARQPGRGQPGQLDRAGGDLAVGERAEVALEAAPLARAREVVEDPEPERAAACHGHGEGGVGANGPFGKTLNLTFAAREPGGDRGRDHLGRDRADGDGGALEQGDQLASVVGPGPGLLAGRRVLPQGPVGGAGRGRARGAGGHGARDRRAGRRASGAAHFFFTDLSPFPVFVACGEGDIVGVALGTVDGTGLTADAPEIP